MTGTRPESTSAVSTDSAIRNMPTNSDKLERCRCSDFF